MRVVNDATLFGGGLSGERAGTGGECGVCGSEGVGEEGIIVDFSSSRRFILSSIRGTTRPMRRWVQQSFQVFASAVDKISYIIKDGSPGLLAYLISDSYIRIGT